MVGAFAGYFIALYLGLASGPSILSLGIVLLGSMIIAAVVGMAIERFAYRPVRKYSRMTTLIMAIGVSLLIENLFVAQIGAAPRAFPDFLGSQSQTPYQLFGNAAISKAQIVIFLVSIALMLLLAVGCLQDKSRHGNEGGFVQSELGEVDGYQYRCNYQPDVCNRLGAGCRRQAS